MRWINETYRSWVQKDSDLDHLGLNIYIYINAESSIELRVLTRDETKHTEVSKPNSWKNSKGGQNSKAVV